MAAPCGVSAAVYAPSLRNDQRMRGVATGRAVAMRNHRRFEQKCSTDASPPKGSQMAADTPGAAATCDPSGLGGRAGYDGTAPGVRERFRTGSESRGQSAGAFASSGPPHFCSSSCSRAAPTV